MKTSDHYPRRREIIERLKADGKLWTGDAFASMPRALGKELLQSAVLKLQGLEPFDVDRFHLAEVLAPSWRR